MIPRLGTIAPKIGILLVAISLLWFVKSRYDASVVEKAALQATQKHLEKQRDSLAVALKASNTRIAHDTVVLNKAISRYVTLRDTIVVTDTVQVKVALARCDSVVSAVGPTIRSLTAGIANRDAIIFNRDSAIKVLNARFPSRLTTAKHVATGVGIGLAIGAVIWAR